MNAWEWAREVFETSLRASWLILALVLLRPVLRRWVPAQFVFLGWLVVAVHLLVPVGIPTQWSLPHFAQPIPLMGETLKTLPTTSAQGSENAGVGAGVAARQASVTSGDKPAAATFSVKHWLVIGWAAGVAALVMMRVIASALFARTLRRGRVACDDRLRAEVLAGSRLLGLERVPEVVVSKAVEAPAIFGLWRPTILFPAGFAEKFSEMELRLMILHELGHWRRRDIAANALLQAARILHWFNPLVWVATRLARQDCELACDEFVMRRASSAETRTYGATLLKVLGVVRGQNRSPQVLGILENKQQLKRRIQMIMNYRTSTVGRVVAGVVLLAALTFVAATREARAETAEMNKEPENVTKMTNTPPPGWYTNGDAKSSFAVGLDPTQPHVKPVSAYIKSIEPVVNGFGGMMQSFSAENYRGKRVRFSAWVKSADVNETANVWMRIDGPGKAEDRTLQFDNMKDRAVRGTTAWEKHSVVLDVPLEAEGIFMGFFISGTGHAWFNDVQFEVVGADVASTNIWRAASKSVVLKSKAPRNLDFGGGAEK
ncbi:hypothetical protein CMV30_01165 [Nibricoccus aquaticus]|uniref:Peptidase M56 domain-containing protein n=1 Tax=Nibricoccus aquaticus TaxID=2576891 RepID=A0A290Q314_9BACT|nr:M56 family metallopeptidase [Nibricoccus aquaticus]ATC62687.1 hypothetical protein CMV30_01165 [Nibricoccus aquaticus]